MSNVYGSKKTTISEVLLAIISVFFFYVGESFAQTSFSSIPCPSCTSNDLGWVQNINECLSNDSNTGLPVKEESTNRGCAIPSNYNEYCAGGDPERCKLLNQIRPPETKQQIARTVLGWCSYEMTNKFGKVECRKYPRFRVSVINTTTEYGCQITNYNRVCNAKDGFLGPSLQLINPPIQVGKEVVKNVVSDCYSYEDPLCQPGCPSPRRIGPPPGPGPGGGIPGPPGGPRGPITGGPVGPSAPGPAGPAPGVVPAPITGARTCPAGWTPAAISKENCSGPGRSWSGPSETPFWDGERWVRDARGGICCVRNPVTGPVDCPAGKEPTPGGPEECSATGGTWIPPDGTGRSGRCCRGSSTKSVYQIDSTSSESSTQSTRSFWDSFFGE